MRPREAVHHGRLFAFCSAQLAAINDHGHGNESQVGGQEHERREEQACHKGWLVIVRHRPQSPRQFMVTKKSRPGEKRLKGPSWRATSEWGKRRTCSARRG
jgi:hypothetical protein